MNHENENENEDENVEADGADEFVEAMHQFADAIGKLGHALGERLREAGVRTERALHEWAEAQTLDDEADAR